MSGNSNERTGSTGLQEALPASLDLEQKGYDYYQEATSRAQNPLTKRLFSVLADQELEHMDRIREIFKKSPSEVESRTIPGDKLENAVKDVFDEFSQQARSAWNVDIADAYEHAMKLEEESVEMYEKLAKESKDSAEIQFFKALEKEEGDHLSALQNVYHFLKGTPDWFEATESQTWNWMST